MSPASVSPCLRGHSLEPMKLAINKTWLRLRSPTSYTPNRVVRLKASETKTFTKAGKCKFPPVVTLRRVRGDVRRSRFKKPLSSTYGALVGQSRFAFRRRHARSPATGGSKWDTFVILARTRHSLSHIGRCRRLAVAENARTLCAFWLTASR